MIELRRCGGRKSSTNKFKSYFFREKCREDEFECLKNADR